MSDGPIPQPGILDIALYVGGESRIPGQDRPLKLSSNENPLGAPEVARRALAAAASSLHRYPSSDHAALRAAIGEVHGLSPDRIICGAGSDEIITFLCQAYAGPGDEVIHTEHGFSMYRISALAAGATPISVPEKTRRVNVERILEAVTDRTRLVFVANPGNPTGTMIDEADTFRLAGGLPPHVVLVLDGAYAEYVDGFDGGASVVDTFPNVVMTRTFSKIYGLGGLRIGWGYASDEVIGVLNRVRGPFNLSTAQLLAAEAAVRERDWVAVCAAENARLRESLRSVLGHAGFPSDPSFANFLLIRLGSEQEAADCDAFLKSRGILVRRVVGYGFPEALRITIGDEEGCRLVAEAMQAFRAASR